MAKPWLNPKYATEQPPPSQHAAETAVQIEPGGKFHTINVPGGASAASRHRNSSAINGGAVDATAAAATSSIGATPGLESRESRYTYGHTSTTSSSSSSHSQQQQQLPRQYSSATTAVANKPSLSNAGANGGGRTVTSVASQHPRFYDSVKRHLGRNIGLLSLFNQCVAIYISLLSMPGNIGRAIYIALSPTLVDSDTESLKRLSLVVCGPILDAIVYPFAYATFIAASYLMGLDALIVMANIAIFIGLLGMFMVFRGGRAFLVVYMGLPALMASRFVCASVPWALTWLLVSWVWYMMAALSFYYEFAYYCNGTSRRSSSLPAYTREERTSKFFLTGNSSADTRLMFELYTLYRMGLAVPQDIRAWLSPSSSGNAAAARKHAAKQRKGKGGAIGNSNGVETGAREEGEDTSTMGAVGSTAATRRSLLASGNSHCALIKLIVESIAIIDEYISSPSRSDLFHAIHPISYLFSDTKPGLCAFVSTFSMAMPVAAMAATELCTSAPILTPHNESFKLSEPITTMFLSASSVIASSAAAVAAAATAADVE